MPDPEPESAAPEPEPEAGERTSKKEQILALFASGITNVEDLALLTQARPSYVGTVLNEAGAEPGYFDLYTPTSVPMNVYSRFFAGGLGFRDERAARASVALIDRLYRQFARVEDRAGQHHALVMALTMWNRARWTGKSDESEVFRRWLAAHVAERAAGVL